MNQVTTPPRVANLEERLANGVQLLFEMEQRGETEGDYQRWLDHWLELLHTYEALIAA